LLHGRSYFFVAPTAFLVVALLIFVRASLKLPSNRQTSTLVELLCCKSHIAHESHALRAHRRMKLFTGCATVIEWGPSTLSERG
jgi:hypothetical protein